MTPWRLALLNLWRRRLPTMIVLLSIAVAIGCSGLLYRLHLLSDSRFATLARGGDALVGAKAGGLDILLGSLNLEGQYPGFLPWKLFESLRSQTQVHFEDGVNVQPQFIVSLIPFVYAGQVEGLRVIGTDEAFWKRPVKDDQIQLQAGQWFERSGEVVAGWSAAQNLGLTIGQSVRVKAWSEGLKPSEQSPEAEMRLTGIMAETGTAWDRAFYIRVEEAQQLLAKTNLNRHSIWGPQVLNYFLVYLKPNGLMPLEALVNQRTVGQVVSVSEQIEKLRDLSGAGQSLGFVISALVMLLGGLSVAGVMMTRFDGMATQVAVLRAIGFAQSEILQWLVWEGALLGGTACLLGAVLDAALFPIVRSLLGQTVPGSEQVQIPVWSSGVVWIIAIVCTIAAVCVPMARIYKQDVHSSLRGF